MTDFLKVSAAQRAEAHYKAALKHQQAGDLAKAIGEYARMLELVPRHPVGLANLGACYGRLGQHDRAVKLLIAADQIKPGEWRILSMIGEAFYHLGQWENALRAYGSAVDLKQDNWEAHLYAGLCLEKLGKLEDAIKALQIACGPDGTNQPARSEFERLRRIKPVDATTH